jgi:hypothetical protein
MMAKATTTKEPTLSPDVIACLAKVREMRAAQMTYFKFRYKHNLDAAMRLEAEVDELLEQVVPKGQRKLF